MPVLLISKFLYSEPTNHELFTPCFQHFVLRSHWEREGRKQASRSPVILPEERLEERQGQQELQQQTQAGRLALEAELDQVSLIANLIHTTDNYQAGSIAKCYAAWCDLTSDKWILDMVKGVKIEFEESPIQSFRPYPIRQAKSERRKLDLALRDMEHAGVIERCQESEIAFLSTVFSTPKKDGSARIILNLSYLNEFIDAPHFKMDTIQEAIYLMYEGCFMASVDFKSAYYAVNIDKRSRKFLGFEWNGAYYRYTALPQGLCTAPYRFTKLMKPPFARLREKDILCLGYIDDTLFIAPDPSEINRGMCEAIRLFDGLGLTIHVGKSVLVATQEIEFLGFTLNSRDMTVRLTTRKCNKIQKIAKRLLRAEMFSS